jgi:hypothetical protein
MRGAMPRVHIPLRTFKSAEESVQVIKIFFLHLEHNVGYRQAHYEAKCEDGQSTSTTSAAAKLILSEGVQAAKLGAKRAQAQSNYA